MKTFKMIFAGICISLFFTSCTTMLQGMASGMSRRYGYYGTYNGGYGYASYCSNPAAIFNSNMSYSSTATSMGVNSSSTSTLSNSSSKSTTSFCRTCSNTKKCTVCHGTGKRTDNYYGTGSGSTVRCGICGGSGRCSSCGR